MGSDAMLPSPSISKFGNEQAGKERQTDASVWAPSSPYAAASGSAPMPALSITMTQIRS
ncbi:hypothetical protein ACF3MZ_02945 [Paenibacillaceae bacterium WGS1546]|uniref:hypothetical protein n=1 Tax=Cohnella sp. WGS1546 TaxID=3366810 RepID=UPI00372D7E5A